MGFIAYRTLGVVACGVAMYLWVIGAPPLITFSRWGVTAHIPGHYILLAIGVCLTVIPSMILHIVAALLPEKRSQGLLHHIQRLEAEATDAIQPTDPPGTVADKVLNIVNRKARDIRLVLVVAMVGGALLLPLIINVTVDRRNFRNASVRLADLVQEMPLDFASSDVVRAYLEEVRGSIEAAPSRNTATHRLYGLLHAAYGAHASDASNFAQRQGAVYDSVLAPHLQRSVLLFEPSFLNQPCNLSVEPRRSCASLLTYQADLILNQADQGRYLPPYLQARQVLAEGLRHAGGEEVPGTHNALGRAFSGLLSRHAEYVTLFHDSATMNALRKSFGESSPLPPASLSRLADQSYEAAIVESSNQYSRARFLNNRVDLRLMLLAMVHLDGTRLSASSTSDERFLEENVAPPPHATPDRLNLLLDSLLHQVTRAIRLSRQPEIYATRAQLHSIGGALGALYRLKGTRWTDTTRIVSQAIADVNTAVSLGLPPRFFTRERARDLRLEWLWQFPSVSAAFAKHGQL